MNNIVQFVTHINNHISFADKFNSINSLNFFFLVVILRAVARSILFIYFFLGGGEGERDLPSLPDASYGPMIQLFFCRDQPCIFFSF